MYLKVAKLSYIILGDFFNCQISSSIGMLMQIVLFLMLFPGERIRCIRTPHQNHIRYKKLFVLFLIRPNQF